MTLKGKTIRNTRTFKRTLPLADFPEKIKELELSMLLICIREDVDKEESIKTIINGHIRLAASIVNRYVTVYNCGHLGDDLDSAAIEGVVVASNRLDTLEHDNVTGYIVDVIHSHVSEYLRKTPMVVTPRGKRFVTTVQLRDTESAEENESDYHKPSNRKFQTPSHWDSRAQADIMESLPRTDEERQILDLRIQGYTDEEVSALMEIPKTKVFTTRQAMKRRYFGNVNQGNRK